MKLYVAVLLILYCLSEADHQAQAEPAATLLQQPDLWAELNKLRDMVVQQQVQIGVMESRLSASEAESKDLRATVVEQRVQIGVMESRLSASESRLSTSEAESKDLRATVVEQRVQLSVMESRLSASEKESKDLRDEVLGVGATVAQQGEKLSNAETRMSASEEEAKKLRDNVEEQRVNLTNMETEVKEQRRLVRVFQSQVVDLQTRLNSTETRLEATEVYAEDHQVRLHVTEVYVAEHQARLNTTEVYIRGHKSRLDATELQVADLEKEIKDHAAQLLVVETRLNSTDDQIQDLKNPPKVAFSAGLGGDVSVSSDTTLVYKNVITNIGNAYNPSTGIFTSNVKGLYQFTFTAAHHKASRYTYVRMYKNGRRLIYNYPFSHSGRWASVSNGLILELEQGDTVYMTLNGGKELQDSGATYNENVFSGFLLYAM